jgi:beta-glucosidase
LRRTLTFAVAVVLSSAAWSGEAKPNDRQPALTTQTIPIIAIGDLKFRDLNRDGRLNPYEDWRLSSEQRAHDLVARMTLPEKAGAMMHGTLPLAGGVLMDGTDYDFEAARPLIVDRFVTSMITRMTTDPRAFAEASNRLQAIAEEGRLGIPLTISTDPRNHFRYLGTADIASTGFSQWPEAAGFGALGDPAAVERFADIARQEYRAVGLHETLSPQADLATEPRWARQIATFGSNADLAASLVRAYVIGFQHGKTGLAADGVAAIVKHWVGYGAAKYGLDSHFPYGRFASVSGDRLPTHIKPFLPALGAGVAGVMPTYSILENLDFEGKPIEQVGVGFNRRLLTDLLRGRYGFDGVILSDWLITNDCPDVCQKGGNFGPPFVIGMPWGVEALSKRQRFVKGVLAGLDQFGGVEETSVLVEAVQKGELEESRLDQSAYRVMLQKFRQGLFDSPFVDPERAARLVGNPSFQAQADAVQRRALVLLQNKEKLLPLRPGMKVFLRNVSPDAARAAGLEPVANVEEADVAIVRTVAPYQILHPQYFLGALFHEGNLVFEPGHEDYDAITSISARVSTVVTVFLDRPAILTGLVGKARAIIGNFGVSDANLLAVVTGKARPEGRLPFELPRSMPEVESQASDLPDDTRNPLFPVGYGLSF